MLIQRTESVAMFAKWLRTYLPTYIQLYIYIFISGEILSSNTCLIEAERNKFHFIYSQNKFWKLGLFIGLTPYCRRGNAEGLKNSIWQRVMK